MGHSCPDTGFDETGRGGENEITALSDRRFNGFFSTFSFLDIVDVEGFHVVRIGFFQIQTAQLMAVGPAGGFSCFFIKESDFDLLGSAGEEPGQA